MAECAGDGQDNLCGRRRGKSSDISCRKAFHPLLKNVGITRIPRIKACGIRNSAFDDFKTAHNANRSTYFALIVDSEDRVKNVEEPLAHLISRDKWEFPESVADDQIFLMTTSMETWIVADRTALKKRFKNELIENNLTPLTELENRDRKAVLRSLENATKTCKTPYAKGNHTYNLFGELDSKILKTYLPAFARMVRILIAKL